jgi:glutamyl-Q tRNA(Asp) synthetase
MPRPAPSPSNYVGRFAPSPTGALHFGSAVAAVASWLAARSAGGRWLVRVEDLDPPREVPGSAVNILATLAQLGLHSDAPLMYQSGRSEAYADALSHLLSSGCAFHCTCTRRELAEYPIYPGNCRSKGSTIPTDQHSTRFLTNDPSIGDFVLRRADGYWAYQLAVVVDDIAQGITHVVRGADLLDSTPRHLQLFKALGSPAPIYSHLPLARTRSGDKLSKQMFSQSIESADPLSVWRDVLAFLHQPPPPHAIDTIEGLQNSAVAAWSPESIPAASNVRSHWLDGTSEN